MARQNHTALDVPQHHTVVRTGEVAGQHHEDEAAVRLDSVRALQVHLEVSKYTPASFADSPPDALKMQLGPPPEDTEIPHIPEAGAKYATLRCSMWVNREEAPSEDTGRTKCRAGPPQEFGVGSHPEDTEGPHILEAGAKYATRKCPGGGPGKTSSEIARSPPHCWVGRPSVWLALQTQESGFNADFLVWLTVQTQQSVFGADPAVWLTMQTQQPGILVFSVRQARRLGMLPSSTTSKHSELSISLPKCAVFRTTALFVNFFVWSKVMVLRLPVEETNMSQTYCQWPPS